MSRHVFAIALISATSDGTLCSVQWLRRVHSRYYHWVLCSLFSVDADCVCLEASSLLGVDGEIRSPAGTVNDDSPWRQWDNLYPSTRRATRDNWISTENKHCVNGPKWRQLITVCVHLRLAAFHKTWSVQDRRKSADARLIMSFYLSVTTMSRTKTFRDKP